MTSIFTVTLPDIGEGVVEGEVIQWLKEEGDSLYQDEPVVMVMTDKATVELPAPHPGTLAKQYHKVGELARLDYPLYDILLKNETCSIPETVIQNSPIKLEEEIEEVSSYVVLLPDIGEGVVEGEVIEWLKNKGDPLKQDEPVVVVMTDKATVELPAPYPGHLLDQHIPVGEKAILDKPLYTIQLANKIEKKKSVVIEKPTSCPKKEAPTPVVKNTQKNKAKDDKNLAIPKIRFLAKELDIDIESVQGTGVDGRVTKEDLKTFLKQESPITTKNTNKSVSALPPLKQATQLSSLPGDTKEPIFGIRRLILEKMVESKYVVPHFTFGDKFDGTRLVKLRESFKKEGLKHNLKVTYMPFFIKALSICLEKFPILNASVDHINQEIVYHSIHNIGIAMKTELGTVIPVLKDVQGKSLEWIIRQFHDLMVKARANQLTSADMKDATFTISNFGAIGGSWGTPVINYPEVGILGIGKMEDTPIVKRNQITIAPITELSWTCDHRIIDGDIIASLSKHFVHLLQHPSELL